MTQGVGSLLFPFHTAQVVSFFAGNKCHNPGWHESFPPRSFSTQTQLMGCLFTGQECSPGSSAMCYWSFLVRLESLSASAVSCQRVDSHAFLNYFPDAPCKWFQLVWWGLVVFLHVLGVFLSPEQPALNSYMATRYLQRREWRSKHGVPWVRNKEEHPTSWGVPDSWFHSCEFFFSFLPPLYQWGITPAC